MEIDPPKYEPLTKKIIGAAIEVHREMGPGLLESIYEWCFLRELEIHQLTAESQSNVKIQYKSFTKEEPLRYDLFVEGKVLVEIKAVERILPIHKAQVLSYMKLLNAPIGLLINFNQTRLVDGISRLILPPKRKH